MKVFDENYSYFCLHISAMTDAHRFNSQKIACTSYTVPAYQVLCFFLHVFHGYLSTWLVGTGILRMNNIDEMSLLPMQTNALK